VGPLFYYELVRLARQWRSTLLRCGYALAILAALYVAYRARFPRHDLWQSPFSPGASLPASDMARLAGAFVYAILWVQTAAVFVLTPAYLAGAIAGERERGTLELLFTTPLRDREIVLGKLAARLLHLGGILLAGLPLLALSQLWGGVDGGLLLAAFGVTGANLLCVGALSVLASVNTRTVPGAMAACYAVTFPTFFCCLSVPGLSPAELFAALSAGGATGWLAIGHEVFAAAGVVLQLGVAVVAVFLAVAGLRPASPTYQGGRGPAPAPSPDPEPVAPASATDAEDLSAATERVAPPPIGERPLLWKEVYQGSRDVVTREFDYGLRRSWRTVAALFLLVQGWLWSLLYFAGSNRPDYVALIGDVTRLTLTLTALAWCVATAFRAAGSVSGERDRQTLDALLTLPSGRTALLTAKWLGAVLRGRLAAYWLVAAAAVGVFSGALRPAALPLMAVSVVVNVAFWAGVGLWLSVVSRTTLRARMSTALVLLVGFGGGWYYLLNNPTFHGLGVSGLYDPGVWDRWPEVAADVGLNPLRAWWFLGLPRGDVPPAAARVVAGRLAASAIGTAVVALAAGLLWWDARRRFRRYELH
jgi:ABC-type transport system involved in multi-copper enzyme maturation permease subunit